MGLSLDSGVLITGERQGQDARHILPPAIGRPVPGKVGIGGKAGSIHEYAMATFGLLRSVIGEHIDRNRDRGHVRVMNREAVFAGRS